MPRTRVKICGLRSPDMALAAAEAGADALGLVFAKSSPRYVTPEEAAAIVATTPAFVETVGLFVTPDEDEIRDTADSLGLSLIQLHGNQPADLVGALWPRRVIRAVHFNPDTGDEMLFEWDQVCRSANNFAGLLIDTPDAGAMGGTGRSFDWTALRASLDRVKPRVPVILAGGLDPRNVAAAIAIVRPWAVDVSSGVESSRGVKDEQKIREFCTAAATAAEPHATSHKPQAEP